MKIRLLSLDRPGFGLSDYQGGRGLADWPGDVKAVANGLGLYRFGVLGVSGGGPYALACARALSDRLAFAGVVCGLGPPGPGESARHMVWLPRLGLALASRAPRLVDPFTRSTAWLLEKFPDLFLRILTAGVPAVDKEVLRDETIRRGLIRSYKEAIRGGTRGPAHDIELYMRPWGFRLEEISVPVHLWHGGRDATVPVEAAREMIRRIPEVHESLHPEEGHFSLPLRGIAEILRAVREAFEEESNREQRGQS
jgi:pimeloyl-ACP methyl ester carboxylesterase